LEWIIINGGSITHLPPNATVMHVHGPEKCAGRTCIIHHATLHHMSEWPLHWRTDRAIFERKCEHEIGHPDPDQIAFLREVGTGEMMNDIIAGRDVITDPTKFAEAYMEHTCDGCCITPSSWVE
jgi:hypothetical protein